MKSFVLGTALAALMMFGVNGHVEAAEKTAFVTVDCAVTDRGLSLIMQGFTLLQSAEGARSSMPDDFWEHCRIIPAANLKKSDLEFLTEMTPVEEAYDGRTIQVMEYNNPSIGLHKYILVRNPEALEEGIGT